MTADQKRGTVRNARKGGKGGKGGKGKRAEPDQTPGTGQATKIGRIVELLARPDGASLADLTAATGWQAHSVRGALAGSLKRKGYIIVSEKVGGLRRYRIGAAR